ncbi:putative pumilio homolog 8, chloroplastic [Cynara cardunculus var. scolymus]|uniref:putative pumilio homolog 8, chloroplastic n=1 Tax=Cynara cardunculus var. scolymus TaxID=59895 RepID=UPI000D630609|nr:putative pumilio homolog 8, chloroplastic [Cynara cardunculus var. scolymus]
METGPREEEFDWLFISQNPTDFAPSSSSVNQQQPPSNTTIMGSSSARQVNGNGSFLGDNTGVFSFQTKQQQQLPAVGNHFVANPVRSIFDHRDRYPADFSLEFNPYDYCCNSCNPDQLYCFGATDFHPAGLASFDHRSSLNGFPETPRERNLEIDFNRLNISSSNHHLLPFLASSPPLGGSTIANNSLIDSSFNVGNIYPQGRVPAPVTPVNRNVAFHDPCCNLHSRRDSFELNPRGLCNLLENPIRSRDWISAYPNPISNSLPQSRQQPKRTKFPASLKDIRGLICLVAKGQEGCQFLQTKCEEGKPEDIEMIFSEIKDHIREFMVDASMNYLAQKLFKVCNERQMTHIVVSVITDDANLTSICLNSHGTRAMQKLIELLSTAEQRSLIVSALRRITVTLTKNTNGHHVIQHCLKSFHVDEVQPILNVVADNCLDIATDKSGCCVLQQCVLHANGVSKERLLTEIIANALHLAEHPYGNYVVQHILGMQIPGVTADILQRLSGNFVTLAMNKYASNVVEKCLKDAPDDQSIPIIREIINSQNFLSVIQHPYGNYVAQSALQTAKGSLKEMMINKVQKEYAFLHSHPHGKRVLALARNSKPRGSPQA